MSRLWAVGGHRLPALPAGLLDQGLPQLPRRPGNQECPGHGALPSLPPISFQPEGGIRVVLKPNLVHRLEASGAAVKTVGKVADKTGNLAHILVGVHHPRRHDQHRRTGFPQVRNPGGPRSVGLSARLSHRTTRKSPGPAKQNISVWSRWAWGPRPTPGLGHRQIGHRRNLLRRGFILAKNFRQPAALISIHHQGSANHPGNLDFHIDSFPVHLIPSTVNSGPIRTPLSGYVPAYFLIRQC